MVFINPNGSCPRRAGEAIGNSEAIRRVHNSFAAPESIVSDESRKAGDDDELYHFVRPLGLQPRCPKTRGI